MTSPPPPPPSASAPPQVLIVCTDLIFSTKITGTAKALKQTYGVARTSERLGELLDGSAGNAVVPTLIIDLNSAGIDPIAMIFEAKAHAARPRVVAFLSHVDVELAEAARMAGADRVMARSGFVNELPAIIASASGNSGI